MTEIPENPNPRQKLVPGQNAGDESSGALPQDIREAKAIEEAAIAEVEELFRIQAPYGAPVEERAQRNEVIRDRLATASDLVVAWAYKRVNLAEKELMKRFAQERPIPLMPLLHYWHNVKRQFETKYDWKIYGLIEETIPRSAPIASQAEIVRLVDRFILVRGESFLAPTLSWRDDVEEISKRVIQGSPTTIISDMWGGKTEVEYRMDGFRLQALALRDKRAQAGSSQ